MKTMCTVPCNQMVLFNSLNETGINIHCIFKQTLFEQASDKNLKPPDKNGGYIRLENSKLVVMTRTNFSFQNS